MPVITAGRMKFSQKDAITKLLNHSKNDDWTQKNAEAREKYGRCPEMQMSLQELFTATLL